LDVCHHFPPKPLSCKRHISLKQTKYPTEINVQRMSRFYALTSVELVFKVEGINILKFNILKIIHTCQKKQFTPLEDKEINNHKKFDSILVRLCMYHFCDVAKVEQ